MAVQRWEQQILRMAISSIGWSEVSVLAKATCSEYLCMSASGKMPRAYIQNIGYLTFSGLFSLRSKCRLRDQFEPSALRLPRRSRKDPNLNHPFRHQLGKVFNPSQSTYSLTLIV